MELSINGVSFSLLEIVVWLIVAALCGGFGSALVGYSPGGLFSSIAVGLVGAVLGISLARKLGLPAIITLSLDGVSVELLWAVVGSALLVLVLSMVRRNGGRGSRRRRYSS